MEGVTLRSRALVFALGTGCVAFFLALIATAQALDAANFARAVIIALVCGVFSWASAERSVSVTAAAIDVAIERLALAGEGDLESPMPPQIGATVPTLARAMDALFRRLRANIDSIERLAMFDPVTELPNRSHFRRRAELALEGLTGDGSAALLFVDLDRFKVVNDTKGHAVGDQLLREVAARLRGAAACSGVDAVLLGRLAGDEFTAFLPHADATGAKAAAEEMLAAFRRPFEIGGATLQIGASIGIAMCPAHGSTLHDLMRAADAAMYHAKASGRGRAELYTDSLAARIADRVKLDAELRDALDGGEFALVFQPQVNLRSGRAVAAEALLRWQHPVDGLRMPSSFIGRAEETGLIVAIGDRIIDKVASTIARWAAGGGEQRLAVNISRRQIDDPSFFSHLADAMAAASAPARLLELEVSETLALHAGPAAVAAIAALRREGATVAIDGFGAGCSSIVRLRDFPVDRIKLDRSVIAPVADHAQARAVAQALIALIHGLGCEAVGEGIETAAQAEVLRVIGCDVIQGYAVAAPMDESEMLAWVARSSPDPIRAITSA